MHTIVIGAGSAGLAASYTLHQQGVEHLVLEGGKVGESWRSQRWESFCLNTPGWSSRLPGEEAPEEPDAFQSRDQVVGRFERYRARFGLPVREGAVVTSVERTPMGFVVSIAGGEPILCERVVVATGDQNVARRPAVAAQFPDRFHQLHAAEYRSPGALPEGGVLVVGSGQTGGQIAEELIEAGRPTWLCTSRVGRFTRRYRGKDALHWADRAGFFVQRREDLPDPAMASWRQPAISGTRGGHTLSLHELARQGVTLLGRLEGVEGGVARIGADLAANLAFGDEVSARVTAMLESAVLASGGSAPEVTPDPAEAPYAGTGEMAEIRELDLDAAGISTVLWATGFGGDFSYLPAAALQNGRPIHREGVSPVPGLLFIGLEWLRKRDSGLLRGVGSDAGVLLG